jgi:putative copper export protein/mono/diheme cytochrome c family protein/peroxiredoxin
MTGLTIAIRTVHLGASLLLAGVFTFLLLVVHPASRTAKAEARASSDHLDGVLLRLATGCLLVMLISGALGLWFQLATATGRPPLQALAVADLWNILTGTQYGRVWIIRTALMVLLAGFLWLRDAEGEGKDWWALRLEGTALAVSLLMAQAWMGHAATGEGLTLVYQVLADGLHLLASGVWLGGLPLLLYLLSWAWRRDDPSAEAVAAEATRRFSALAFVCVGVLLITGSANAWELVGTIPALVGTTYGRLLLLKIVLLLPLLGLAALNLLREKPHLARALHDQGRRDVRQSLRRLRRNVGGELLVGSLILLIVGALGSLPPAYHEQPTWPFSFRLSWEATKDLPGVRTSTAIGIQIAMFGLFVALLAGITRVRYWLGVVAAGLLAVGVGFAVWLPKLAIDAYPTTYLRPAIPYNALSIANGLRLYGEHCAVCHGVGGYGDGPAAPGLRPPPADLTAKHTADHTAGDIFWWLTHGKPGTAMPGFAAQLSEEDRWDLINFVRALSAAEQARVLGPQVGANLWVVAPDFTYTTRLGDARTLKDHRGREQVLLVFFTLPESLPRLSQLRDVYPQIRTLGVEVLVIPLQGGSDAEDVVTRLDLPFPLVSDGAQEAAVAYTLFRRSFGAEGSQPDPPIPPHVEFVIDRPGYLRARWLPQEATGWAETEALLSAIAQLNQEKFDVPAPDLHVH